MIGRGAKKGVDVTSTMTIRDIEAQGVTSVSKRERLGGRDCPKRDSPDRPGIAGGKWMGIDLGGGELEGRERGRCPHGYEAKMGVVEGAVFGTGSAKNSAKLLS